jgi:hypothetical protein
VTEQERSYLLPGLGKEDRTLLAGVPRGATLEEEIAYLRLRILRLAEGAGTEDKDRQHGDQMLVRLLELLTRMVAVQAKLSTPGTDKLAELNELVRQRLVAAGFPDPEEDPAAAIKLLRRRASTK